MDKKSKNTLIVSIIALALVLIGVTYAYFSARITGLESASTIQLTAGRMGIVYTEGNDEFVLNNIYPRSDEWATKHFTLTGYNTTDQNMSYRVGLQIITNEFPSGYLTYDLISTTATSGTPMPNKTGAVVSTSGTTWLGKGTFVTGNGETHAYTLKIYFKDNGYDQNDAQEASFFARIVINEFVEENIILGFNGPRLYNYTVNTENCLDFADNELQLTPEASQIYCSGGTVGGTSLNQDIETDIYLLELAIEYEAIENFSSNILSYNINTAACLEQVSDWIATQEEKETYCSGGQVNGYGIDEDITDGYAFDMINSGVLEDFKYINNNEIVHHSPRLNTGFTYEESPYTYVFEEIDGVYGWHVRLTQSITQGNSSFYAEPGSIEIDQPVTGKFLTTIQGYPIIDVSDLYSYIIAPYFDLSTLDSSNVVNMNRMFYLAGLGTTDLRSLDTSNVTDMSYMFYRSSAASLDLSSFDTSNVTNMNWMFCDAVSDEINVSSFNTSNITSFDYMFSGTTASILDLSSFDTTNVVDMSEMFFYSDATIIDLSSFDTSNVTSMNQMFYSCDNLTTIYASDKFNGGLGWNMFSYSTSLVGGAGTVFNPTHNNITNDSNTYAHIDGGPSNPGYFTMKK